MNQISDTHRILCVLSDAQTAEYRDEFLAAGGSGVQFVFDADADRALDRVPQLQPTVVVVGMTLVTMDPRRGGVGELCPLGGFVGVVGVGGRVGIAWR